DGPQPHVVVLQNNGDGTFTPQEVLALPDFATATGVASSGPLAVGDFLGTGRQQVALVGQGGDGSNALDVLAGEGDGNVSVVRQALPVAGTPFVAAANLDGDDYTQLVVGSDSSSVLTIFALDGGGVPQAEGTLTAPGPVSAVLAGDFTDDGIDD